MLEKSCSPFFRGGDFAIAVDAFNEDAKAFYLKYGFIPLEDNPLSLLIPMKTILAVLE
ncbi:hypothetical protein [Okeania sp.]|uniref:hypothetical protein n=1 Tax=Okeania sp. TaxID=3100323 RepID=UPI002B4AD58C|nr:hypothetical protein [Okeania sp.]MEB3342618.1 hypothetical protein [Okeania sp.]